MLISLRAIAAVGVLVCFSLHAEFPPGRKSCPRELTAQQKNIKVANDLASILRAYDPENVDWQADVEVFVFMLNSLANTNSISVGQMQKIRDHLRGTYSRPAGTPVWELSRTFNAPIRELVSRLYDPTKTKSRALMKLPDQAPSRKQSWAEINKLTMKSSDPGLHDSSVKHQRENLMSKPEKFGYHSLVNRNPILYRAPMKRGISNDQRVWITITYLTPDKNNLVDKGRVQIAQLLIHHSAPPAAVMEMMDQFKRVLKSEGYSAIGVAEGSLIGASVSAMLVQEFLKDEGFRPSSSTDEMGEGWYIFDLKK